MPLLMLAGVRWGACYDRCSRLARLAPATGPLPVEQPPDTRPPPREANFLQVVLAVWASFFGVRKRRMHDELAPSVKPQHLIVAGVLGALFLVLALIAVVRIVIANA